MRKPRQVDLLHHLLEALIRGTDTKTGLQVEAFLVDKLYVTGLKVANAVMSNLNLERHAVCPNWNYTIRPHLSSAMATGS